MKKVGRFSLFELEDASSVIDKASQKTFIGGGSGSFTEPYTQDEFDSMMYSGHWNGGFVYGMGWVIPQVYIYSNRYKYAGGYRPSGGGGGGSFWPGGGWPGSGGNAGGYNPNHNSYYHGHNGYWGHNGYSNHYGYPGFYGYHSSGGGGGEWGGSDNSGSLTDGVNINDSRHFTFETESQAVFHQQLTNILKSNSVLKSLLSYFNKGIIHMTFEIDDVNSIAQTTYPSHESFKIIFNSKFIDENGWNKILEQDNVGYDWSKVNTPDEALVIVLAHEAQHANHVARYYDALKQAENWPGKAALLLSEWEYDQEFIDIFFHTDEDGKWQHVPGEQQVENMHEYMKKYNQSVFDKALEEYREDYNR